MKLQLAKITRRVPIVLANFGNQAMPSIGELTKSGGDKLRNNNPKPKTAAARRRNNLEGPTLTINEGSGDQLLFAASPSWMRLKLDNVGSVVRLQTTNTRS